MDELDLKIRHMLSEAINQSGESASPSLSEEIRETFHGPHKLLNIGSVVKLVGAGILFYWCVYAFFQQSSVKAMIAYATAAVLCTLTATTTMLWLRGEMYQNAQAKKLRRLELCVLMLTKSIEGQETSGSASNRHIEE